MQISIVITVIRTFPVYPQLSNPAEPLRVYVDLIAIIRADINRENLQFDKFFNVRVFNLSLYKLRYFSVTRYSSVQFLRVCRKIFVAYVYTLDKFC